MSVTRPRLAVAVGIVLTLGMGGLLSLDDMTSGAVIILMVPPIMIASYLGGLWPGLATTVLATVWGMFLSTPTGTLSVEATRDVERLIALFIVGIAVSVTFEALHRARRRTQQLYERTHTHQQRLLQMFMASPVAKSMSRLGDRTVVEVNRAYCDVFGVTEADIVGRTPQAAGIDVASTQRDEIFAALRDEGEIRDREARVITADGRHVTVLVSSQNVVLDGERLVLSTFVDITSWRAAEAQAQASSERLRQLAEAIGEVFWLVDVASAEIIYISPAYERIWGRPVPASRSPQIWLETIHPEDLPRVIQASQLGPATGDSSQRYRIVRPDGTVRWIQDRAFPVRDADGNVFRIAGVAQDITDQLLLQENLHRAQKLESIGLLAGGVAHDFNNILCVITGNVEFLLDTAQLSAEEREALEEIEASAKRAATITRQLLAVGRKQVTKPIVLDLNETVAESHRMLGRMVGEEVQLEVTLDPAVGRVLIDPGQIEQILMNLCVNARDVLGPGGVITVGTRATETEALLLVTDNGPGMTDDVKARLFEPFFTTKPVGKGTGLGLPVVYGIVEQAGGRIEIESAPGHGATFTIRLPMAERPVTRIAKPRHSTARPGTERILIVDDDASLRATAARTLRHHGYDVTEAGSGADALQILRAEPAFALMVTDVVMPGMSGRQLAEAAAPEFPAMRVLYMSGYTDDVVMRRGIHQSDVAFLEKPFAGEALAEKVREVLDRSATPQPLRRVSPAPATALSH